MSSVPPVFGGLCSGVGKAAKMRLGSVADRPANMFRGSFVAMLAAEA